MDKKQQERAKALRAWLIAILNGEEFKLVPLTGDASFRRYFRLYYKGKSRIVMDAPPAQEKLESFIYIAQIFAKMHISTPEIFATNLKEGFLLLSDLGDELLLNNLTAQNMDNYYQHAIEILFKIQKCSITDSRILLFSKHFMIEEMSLCTTWFLKSYLSLPLTQEEYDLIQQTMVWIASQVACQPLTFIHRDYHSRNLMVINKLNTLGVIDFQDAMRGPLTYDLVSLLKDCYITWPRAWILQKVAFYHQQNDAAKQYSLPEFIRAFDLCGLQRHLKILGIFSRLYLRDNKSGYLKNLPLTLEYVLECCEIYKELHPFFNFLQQKVILPCLLQ